MIEARCFGRSEIVTPAGQVLPTSELVFAFALYLCVRAGEHVPRTDLVDPLAVALGESARQPGEGVAGGGDRRLVRLDDPI